LLSWSSCVSMLIPEVGIVTRFQFHSKYTNSTKLRCSLQGLGESELRSNSVHKLSLFVLFGVLHVVLWCLFPCYDLWIDICSCECDC
jgi:hypothetical protein